MSQRDVKSEKIIPTDKLINYKPTSVVHNLNKTYNNKN